MKYIIIIIVIFFSAAVYPQIKPAEENNLAELLEKMRYFKYDSPDYDSLTAISLEFSRQFYDFISQNPESMTDSLSILQDMGLLIADSDDRLLRIYSWDTETGGTMRFYENIYQFNNRGKVFVQKPHSDIEGDPNSWFSKIITFKTDGGAVYAGMEYSDFSTSDKYTGLKFMKIESNKLNDNYKIVKTSDGMESTIGVGYDFFSVSDRPERPVELIKFDPVTLTVSSPIVNAANGSVTDKFETYKFTGKYFEKEK